VSQENTRNIDGRSFEERVFARFDGISARFDGIDRRFDGIDARLDGIDARFDAVETRLEALETQVEKRALETKPIWERALAEILEIRESLATSSANWMSLAAILFKCEPIKRTWKPDWKS